MSKADFYTGHGKDAVYIGSLSSKGDPVSIPADILIQTSWNFYEYMVEKFLEESEHGHLGHWFWDWPSSEGTDYTYMFVHGRVFCSIKGESLFFDPIKIKQGEDLRAAELQLRPAFPQMGR